MQFTLVIFNTYKNTPQAVLYLTACSFELALLLPYFIHSILPDADKSKINNPHVLLSYLVSYLEKIRIKIKMNCYKVCHLAIKAVKLVTCNVEGDYYVFHT
jgi:hypothetical protein